MNYHNFLKLKERLSHVIDTNSFNINKLYEELLSFFSETEDNFITRRHRELKEEGYINKEIYSIVSGELKDNLFKGRNLTERQIKRIIYKE